MGIPVAANVNVNLYRTANPSSVYTLGPLVENVDGYLSPDAYHGRFGSASWLKWTHVLLVDATVDIRDAYNSQLDPSRNNNLADTVVLTGSEGNKTAYYVVFVEEIARGTSSAHLRVYLDRFAPQNWPTNSL
jgi:hypothetical protein